MTNIELEINGTVDTLEQALDYHAIAEDIRPKTPDSTEEADLYSAYDCMEAAAGRLHEVTHESEHRLPGCTKTPPAATITREQMPQTIDVCVSRTGKLAHMTGYNNYEAFLLAMSAVSRP